MMNKRFGVGRTGKTKQEVVEGSSIKAFIGIIFFMAFIYIIYLSINYKEDKFGSEGVNIIKKDKDGDVNIGSLSDCSVKIYISKEKSDRGLEIKDLVRGLGFNNVSMSFIVSAGSSKDRLYYIPTSNISINQLTEWASTISKKGMLPEPVQLDAQFIVGQDITVLCDKALNNVIDDISGLNIEVLNGSGIGGAASYVADILRKKGGIILDVRNADSFDYKKTFIKTGLGQRGQVTSLASLFGLGDGRIDDSLDQIIIVLCE
ncbi:MAG: LytR C-terminal domain-containing protein [bacterium]